MTKRACECIDCRLRNEREFFAVVRQSYTTTELEELYPTRGLAAAVTISKLAEGVPA